ncbi:MAG: J domain-containing protein [Planctomycetota bacterium]
MNPFEALGLAPTADRAAIRRAYAQGVRLHRPDDDPAGFRAVRDAYELLSRLPDADLAALVADATAVAGRTTAPTGTDAAADAAGTADAPAAAGEREETDGVVLPATWTQALHAARALPAGAARDEAVVAALEAAARDAHADPSLWRAWQRALETSIEGRGDLLLGLVPEDRAVALLRHAPSDLPAILPQGFVATRRWGRLRGMAAAVLEAAPTLDQPIVVLTFRALAVAIAVLDPAVARSLADRAFALAPPAMRGELALGVVDTLARVGDEWADRSGEAKLLLTSIAAGVYDPASPLGGERDVIHRTGRLGADSATAQLLREGAPTLLERAAASANASAEASGRRTERNAHAARKAATSRNPLRSLPWYVLVGAVAILRLVSMCQPRTPPPTYKPPSRLFDPSTFKLEPSLTELERARKLREDLNQRARKANPAPGTPTPGGGR